VSQVALELELLEPPDRLDLVVYGKPQPAGSKRVLPAGGRPGGRPLVVDSNKNAKEWKRAVAQAAGEKRGDRPLLEGALRLTVLFYMPRPKGHYGTGRNAGVLKNGAPPYPTVKPDTTKLLRAVEDALTAVVWRDDTQVVSQWAGKLYGEPARCEITVEPLTRGAP